MSESQPDAVGMVRCPYCRVRIFAEQEVRHMSLAHRQRTEPQALLPIQRAVSRMLQAADTDTRYWMQNIMDEEAAALLPGPTIDVERLERALAECAVVDVAPRRLAEQVAAEYARLSEPKPQVISGYVDPSGKGEGNWDEG